MEKKQLISIFRKFYDVPMVVMQILLGILLCVRLRIGSKLINSWDDLFYWPQGACVDMIVIYATALVAGAVLIYAIWKYYCIMRDNFRTLKEMISELYGDCDGC